MSTLEQPAPFVPYECSLGTVIGHDSNAYRIATADGRTIGIAANGELSAENVEADIANPPAPVLSEQEVWDNFLAGYISVPHGEGFIELKANRQARNDFIGQATLLREAVDAGLITGESNTSIWDRSNVEHTLTVAECRLLLVRYGILWQTSFNELAP